MSRSRQRARPCARASVVVIDACGAGELPDAADYGDAGPNTLEHLAEAVGGLRLPTLQRLGLGSITELAGVAPAARPGRARAHAPAGPGQGLDHRPLGAHGRVPPTPLPTYPEGFPPDVVAELERVTGHTFLCNRPYNGIAVIEAFGERAAAHRCAHPLHVAGLGAAARRAHRRVPRGRAHAACRAAREAMRGRHAVGPRHRPAVRGRTGGCGARRAARTSRSTPPARSYLDVLTDGGIPVHAVGKVRDLFAGVGVTESLRARRARGDRWRRPQRCRRHGARPGVREPRRDRPGLRAPQGRRGLRRRAGGDRRDRRGVARRG